MINLLYGGAGQLFLLGASCHNQYVFPFDNPSAHLVHRPYPAHNWMPGFTITPGAPAFGLKDFFTVETQSCHSQIHSTSSPFAFNPRLHIKSGFPRCRCFLFGAESSGQTNEHRNDRGKRCTHTREALEAPPQTPCISHNPWRLQAVLWFFLGAEVGWRLRSTFHVVKDQGSRPGNQTRFE